MLYRHNAAIGTDWNMFFLDNSLYVPWDGLAGETRIVAGLIKAIILDHPAKIVASKMS